MSGKPTPSDDVAQTQMTRRGAMAAVAVATGTAVGVGATAGTAVAADSINFDSDLVPNPRLEAEVEVGEHDMARMASALEFIDDDGEVASLASYGGTVASRGPEEDEDEDPLNPVTIEPRNIEADDFYQFPRGEYDDDDDAISALDPDHWDDGDATVTDGSENPSYSVRIEGDGEAVFDAFDDISSGVRRELQFVMTAENLDGTVTVGVEDASGNQAMVEAGPDLDADDDDVFATEIPEGGVVVQREIGQINDGIGDIAEVFVDVEDGDAVTFTALNVERESKWDLGTKEVYDDEDEEVVTETVEQPTGAYSVTDVDTFGSTFDDATIYDLHVDAEVSADQLPTERVDTHFGEDSRFPAYDTVATLLYTFSLPSGYDISVSADAITDEQSTHSDRYAEAGVLEDASDAPPYTYDDLEDDEDDFMDVTEEYSESIGDEVTLVDDVSGGDDTVLRYDMLMTTEEEVEATSGDAIGGGFVGEAGSRIWSIPGMIISALGLAGLWQYFAGGN